MIARLMPTARAMSSICASRTPRSSNRVRVASRISLLRSARRLRDGHGAVSLSGCTVGGWVVGSTHEVRLRAQAPGGAHRGRVRATRPPATSRRRSPSSTKRIKARCAGQRPARRHRHRQDRHDRLAGRAAAASDAGDACPTRLLAAQFANELRELLPNNAVEYFVSYYDYYQPEAYIAQSDTYIEKDSSINEEVERLRHSATWSLLTRRDVIVVATVSCIYGLGSAQEYLERMIGFKVGEEMAARPAAAHARRGAVRPQRRRLDPRHVPGQGRHRRDLPRLPGDRGPGGVLRRRDRAAHDAAPADRRGAQRRPGAVRRRGDALRRRPGARCARRSRRSRSSSRSASPSSSARASCSRRSDCACARRTTSR